MFKLTLGFLAAMLAIVPLSAQTNNGTVDFKTSLLKHLRTSEDFSVKVAEAMPEDNYAFKLTKEQMSFGEQMTHLSQALSYYARSLSTEKAPLAKPASTSKADIIAFMKSSFDFAIGVAEKMTPEQIAKSYPMRGGESQTGFDLLMGMLNHTTNHRASAEMYLRVKGITPPQYQF